MKESISPFSITRAQLECANNLKGLNESYAEDWVKEYLSVEIETINNGKVYTDISGDDVLNKVQKDNMTSADEGSDISVNPNNNLKNNAPKENPIHLPSES